MRSTNISRQAHLFALVLAACDLPRDPESSLERARTDALRVGVAHNPPWVAVEPGSAQPQGIEVALVTDIARTAGSRVRWIPGAESELLHKLKDHELDVVIGGLTDDLPWKAELGFTKPYYDDLSAKKKYVLAVAPGENALLVHVERRLLRARDSIAASIRRAAN